MKDCVRLLLYVTSRADKIRPCRLPITVQPEFIRKALAAGKHVLSEKPIAKDVTTATQLLSEYRKTIDSSKTTWSIAENWRFLESHVYAAEEVRKLGRILGFRTRVHSMIKPGGKYFETAWRKTPEYQGGFLLDGGIHFVAATRLFLGPDNDFARVSAFTHQLQQHLPPADTVNAIVRTKSGVSGTFAVGFGTTFKGSGYTIACEDGVVTALRDKVVVEKDGQETEKTFTGQELGGVAQEMQAWGEGLAAGAQDPRLSLEEALKDLVAVRLSILSQCSAAQLLTTR